MSKTKVLAKVNSKEITQYDVDLLLESLGTQNKQQFNSEEGKKRILEELITQELLYTEALEKGYNQDEAFLKEIEQVKRNLLKQYAIRKLFSDIKIEDNDSVEYYNSHKEQFKTPESVNASHILVDTKEKALEILEEINAGLAFAEAAKKYSKCPSNAKGGDLGYFSKGQMVPEFENAAFAMQVAEISDPVNTQYGFHLIKVLDRKDPGFIPFEEVKQQIFNQLVSIKQNELYVNKRKELEGTYKVDRV